MFNVGDIIIYSAQGVCCIDDICEKTYMGVTRNYYTLHPLGNSNLKISAPVDNDKVTMLELVDKDEAEEIIESFRQPGISWIESWEERSQKYREIMRSGNRMEISRLLNALMRKKQQDKVYEKKFCDKDDKLLDLIKSVLFTELAISLKTTFEAVNEKVISLINEDEH